MLPRGARSVRPPLRRALVRLTAPARLCERRNPEVRCPARLGRAMS